jgi:signal transduction histidine kinase/DNA-binding response OmpR family regulator
MSRNMDNDIYTETRKTIFLADRNGSFLIYLRLLLERMGFRVLPLKKGAILRNLMEVMKPDLVMLGGSLEDMGGLSVLKTFRQNKDFAGIPVIMFCEPGYEECGQTVGELGRAKCLYRPVNIFQLYKEIYDNVSFSPGEKRIHLRTSFHEKVLISYAEGEMERWATSLSEGGIFVRCRDQIPRGEDVRVSVPLGFDSPVHLQGKILYSTGAEPGRVLSVPGIAIQFVSVTPEQAFQLRICILGLLVGDLLEEQRDEPIFSVVSHTNDIYEDIVLDHIRVGQALKSYQMRMKRMVDTLPFSVLIYELRDDGYADVVNVNPAARELFGSDADSLEGLSARFPNLHGRSLCETVKSLALGNGKVEFRSMECPDIPAGFFDILAFQTSPGNVAVILQDVSERRKQEEEDLRTQKLESLGSLAGGIAHDFNNLLQGVFGYIEIAKMNYDNKDKMLAMLSQAEEALHQSANLTRQLLTFSKGGKPIRKLIDLRNVIENSTKFTLSGSWSDFRIDIAPDLWQVEADEGQIGQVIQNILLNAEQSMPTGGAILITAKNIPASDRSAPPGPIQGNHVLIAIKDTGIGIPEQYIPKIFDPYFTTKEKGRGLGLATSYSIVQNHGGMIDVKSVLDKGTTLFIYLPAVETKQEIEETALIPPTSGRKGRILVMDDEKFIRETAKDAITALGHDVDLAENGEAAIEKYRAGIEVGKPFDVVILDLTIRGGMGGRETIQRLKKIDPSVRAIVSSGYSDDDVIANYKNYGFQERLVKPYKLAVLRDTLNALLSSE